MQPQQQQQLQQQQPQPLSNDLFTLKKVDERLWPFVKGSGALNSAFSGDRWGPKVLSVDFCPGHIVLVLKWQKPSWTVVCLDSSPGSGQLSESELSELKMYFVNEMCICVFHRTVSYVFILFGALERWKCG